MTVISVTLVTAQVESLDALHLCKIIRFSLSITQN